MDDAILIFTFSPVQSFIAEARRAADLFTGSQILVELANAAGEIIHGCSKKRLIYPATLDEGTPNKLVACVPWNEVRQIAENAEQQLLERWLKIADEAKKELKSKDPKPDSVWEGIWERQINNLWEIYWAAASMESRSYKDAYKEASRVLEGVKRIRCFEPSDEYGSKDTLSGRRSALHTDSSGAKAYWEFIGKKVRPPKLRPEGRERLDAIGAIKRFCNIADESFPSTSTVAAAEFLELARPHLADYRSAVEELLGGYLYIARKKDKVWPYDGDLLYMETLTENRLKDSYGITQTNEDKLKKAQEKLRELYNKVGSRPSPYYAVIVLDGDKMGERINRLLETADPEIEHRNFSEQLAKFACAVRDFVGEQDWVIYNGGDDVLALSPLAKAVPLASNLAAEFARITRATASAGIAIVHHLYPLDAALAAARKAEEEAKHLRGRNAVCIHVLRRSGERVHIGSEWDDLGARFDNLVARFKSGEISSKFAYDLLDEARTITGLEDKESRSAVLKRLIKRHKTPLLSKDEEDRLLVEMRKWSDALDKRVPEENGSSQGFAELGRWLVFARFVAEGGRT